MLQDSLGLCGVLVGKRPLLGISKLYHWNEIVVKSAMEIFDVIPEL